MSDNEKLKVGVIGGGRIGQMTAPYYNTSESKVTDVYRRNPDEAREFGAEIGAESHSEPGLSEMLSKPLGLVVLTVIPGKQTDIAIQCAKFRIPLYAEKMFAGNYQNAQKVVQAYKDANLPLFVAHFCRCMPQIQFVKKMLEKNKIGKIKSIQMKVDRVYNEKALKDKKWMQDPTLAGGGWFADLGPHYIDALIYLFGDLSITDSKVEQTFPEYKNLEDRVQLGFKTEEGISGSAKFNFNSDRWGDSVIVEGQKGSISFKVLGRDASVIIKKNNGKEECTEFKNEHLLQAPMIRQIINILNEYKYANKTLEQIEKEARAKGLCTGQDALLSSKIILEQIEKEARAKGLCTGQDALLSSKIISDVISKFHKQIGYSEQKNIFLSRIDARGSIGKPAQESQPPTREAKIITSGHEEPGQ